MSETKLRRYGVWAGNRAGVAEDPKRCVKELHDRYHPGGYQCTRPRGHGPGGCYCKQHDPAAVAAREKASRDRFDAKRRVWAAADRRAQFCKAAEVALRQIEAGHNDPRALAAEVLKMVGDAGIEPATSSV